MIDIHLVKQSIMAQTRANETLDERPLSLDEYKRYGRQMIMPNWGLPGQSTRR